MPRVSLLSAAWHCCGLTVLPLLPMPYPVQLLAQKRDADWQVKKAAKERADWEARMQDGFRWVRGPAYLCEVGWQQAPACQTAAVLLCCSVA